MDLNKILLSPEQVEALYKKALVLTEPYPVAELETAPLDSRVDFTYKGKFRKRLLWLVYNETHPYLDESDFEYLSRILEACGMNWDDIALLNAFELNLPVLQVVQKLQPAVVIATGLPIELHPKATPFYEVQPFSGALHIATDAFPVVKADKTLRLKLWNALKQMLGL